MRICILVRRHPLIPYTETPPHPSCHPLTPCLTFRGRTDDIILSLVTPYGFHVPRTRYLFDAAVGLQAIRFTGCPRRPCDNLHKFSTPHEIYTRITLCRLSYLILSCLILSHFILFYFILSPLLSSPLISSQLIPSHAIPSHLILTLEFSGFQRCKVRAAKISSMAYWKINLA